MRFANWFRRSGKSRKKSPTSLSILAADDAAPAPEAARDAPEAPSAEALAREPTPVAQQPAPVLPPPEISTREKTGARAERVVNLLTLERLLPELEAARNELATSRERIQELQIEHNVTRAEAARAHHEKREADHRAESLQKALEDMERRLRELETGESEIPHLQAERDQFRAEATAAFQELQEKNLQVRALEAQLDVFQREGPEDKRATEERLQQLAGEKEQLASQLTSKTQEILSLRQAAEAARAPARPPEGPSNEAQEQLRHLEMELERQKELVRSLQEHHASVSRPEGAPSSEEAAASASSGFKLPLPPPFAEPLYERTVVPITVLMASADLLLMSPGLDSSLQDIIRDIKTQGQSLLDIIKEFTQTPEDDRPQAGN